MTKQSAVTTAFIVWVLLSNAIGGFLAGALEVRITGAFRRAEMRKQRRFVAWTSYFVSVIPMLVIYRIRFKDTSSVASYEVAIITMLLVAVTVTINYFTYRRILLKGP